MAYERTRLHPAHRKPDVHGCHWTDEDMAPYMSDDYDSTEQSEAAQMMLDLAEQLANARAHFALAKSRVNQDRIGVGVGQMDRMYVPRVCDISIQRRGFSVGHGAS
jgi:rubrerythrin